MAARRGAEAPVTIDFGYAELLRLYPPPDRQLLLLDREFAPPPVTRAVPEVPFPTELLSQTERVRSRSRSGSHSQARATVTPCASTTELPSPTGPKEAGLRSGTGLGRRNSCSRPIRARSNRSSSCHWRYRPTPNYRHWRYRMDESSRHERDPRERQVLSRRGFRMPEQWDVRPHPTIPRMTPLHRGYSPPQPLMEAIYLDYNGSAPLDPRVVASRRAVPVGDLSPPRKAAEPEAGSDGRDHAGHDGVRFVRWPARRWWISAGARLPSGIPGLAEAEAESRPRSRGSRQPPPQPPATSVRAPFGPLAQIRRDSPMLY